MGVVFLSHSQPLGHGDGCAFWFFVFLSAFFFQQTVEDGLAFLEEKGFKVGDKIFVGVGRGTRGVGPKLMQVFGGVNQFKGAFFKSLKGPVKVVLRVCFKVQKAGRSHEGV